MATDILTIPLDGSDVSGSSYVDDKDDTQIVTFTDGGDISGSFTIKSFGKKAANEDGQGPGGDDQFYFDLSGFDDDFDITIKSFDSGDVFHFTNWDTMTTDGTVTKFTYTGSDGLKHTVTIDAESENGTGTATVVCFTRGTLIETAAGPVAVENLSVGDMLRCGDGVMRPIRWIGSRGLDAAALRASPDLCPVRLRAGALGRGRPAADMMLSPQHRVLLRDWRAELMFGQPEVLVSARQLCNDDSIHPVTPAGGVTYFHILLEGHHTIFADGLECETLMPAELAQVALPGAARQEILDIFPELSADLGRFGDLCAPALKKHEAAALMGVIEGPPL